MRTKLTGVPTRRFPRGTQVFLVATILVGGGWAGRLHAGEWLTGAELTKRLARRVDFSWTDNPLREALRNLSRSQEIAILLDRRVDPGQEFQLRVADRPLEDALVEIAESRHLGVSWLGPVAYFGPVGASRRLRTVAALRADEVRQLPKETQRRLLLPKALAWDDFAEPRALLEELAEENGLDVVGMDRVPHDLWAAADLPPLSLVDRLTLLLIQFDLTFEPDAKGAAIRLAPLPAEVAIARSYPAGPEPETAAERLRELIPGARVTVIGEQIEVVGLIEDHERLGGTVRPADRSPPAAAGEAFADKEFTLRVEEQPVGAVVQALAKQLQLDVRIDDEAIDEAGRSLDTRVSFSVENATIDGLLRELLAPAGLQCRRRDRVVEIFPAP